MKIHIGPYANYRSVYQIGDFLKDKFELRQEICDSVCDFLKNKTPLGKVCDYVNRPRQRHIEIEIDDYDTWNMDTTLSLIILPMLLQLKRNKRGSLIVSDDDLPCNLKSSKAPSKKNLPEYDAFLQLRWTWILNEIIWTFEQLQPDSHWEDAYYQEHQLVDHEGYTLHNKRIANGLILFGKYFRHLFE